MNFENLKCKKCKSTLALITDEQLCNDCADTEIKKAVVSLVETIQENSGLEEEKNLTIKLNDVEQSFDDMQNL